MLKRITVKVLLVLACMLTFADFCEAGSVPYRLEKKSIASKKKTIDIKIQYPKMIEAKDVKAMEAFNRLIGGHINTDRAEFEAKHKKEYESTMQPWSLFGTYDIYHTSARLVCLKITMSKYWGGAHGMPEYFTVVFDMNARRRLTLKSLFREDSSYLKAISDYCTTELMKGEDVDADWIKKGTAPKAENFKNFYFDKKGMTVIFDPYQVAAYYQGSPQVTIPFSVIGKHLKENSPLTELF